MLKARNLVVLALVGAFGQAAWGQGTPVSYVISVSPTAVLAVDGVPAGGFVLTDVVGGLLGATQKVMIAERDVPSDPNTLRLQAIVRSTTTVGLRLHLQSGVFFEAGKQIWIWTDTEGNIFTLSGYIPGPQPNVPAVGTWGLCVMVLMIVVGGTMVLRQRKPAAA